MPDEHDETYDEYKEEQEELNNSDVFVERYGIEHDCRCAEDWAEGNWAVVSVCYLTMCGEALDALSDRVSEAKDAKAEIAQLKLDLAAANAAKPATSAKGQTDAKASN